MQNKLIVVNSVLSGTNVIGIVKPSSAILKNAVEVRVANEWIALSENEMLQIISNASNDKKFDIEVKA